MELNNKIDCEFLEAFTKLASEYSSPKEVKEQVEDLIQDKIRANNQQFEEA